MRNYAANKLLTSMETGDRLQLQSHFETVTLAYRQRLEKANRNIPYVYFLLSGMASIVYSGAGNNQIDVGVVGNEGCTGCSVILACDRAPQAITVQASGMALRIRSEDFSEAIANSPTLRRTLLRYVQTTVLQRDETALAAAKASILERLARWLLMAQDRMDTTDLHLTHEMLAHMLGVGRSGVTLMMRELRARGLVDNGLPGHIRITDREGLRTLAGSYYGTSQAEFQRLLQPCVSTDVHSTTK
jgi:CRP-like cAMP-binding protein